METVYKENSTRLSEIGISTLNQGWGLDLVLSWVSSGISSIWAGSKVVIFSVYFSVAISVLCSLGNGGILLLICKSKRFKRPVNYMIANMAAMSIYRVFFITLLSLVRGGWMEISSTFVCKIYAVLHRACDAMQGFCLTCLSVERNRSVRNPWDRETSSGSCRKIVYIWIATFAIELPHIFFWDVVKIRKSATTGLGPEHDSYKCYNTQTIWGNHYVWIVYLFIHLLVVKIGPSVYLIKDLVSLLSSLQFLKLSCVPNSCGPREYDSRVMGTEHVRVLRNGVIFTAIFIIIDAPVGIWYTLYQIPPSYISDSLRDLVLELKPVFYIAAIINSSFFPILVFVLSRNFRNYCQSFFKCNKREV